MRKAILLILIMLTFGISAGAYDNIPVLMYHNIDYVFSKDQSLSSTTPTSFENHLKTFKEKGYTSISVKDYIRSKSGEYTLPEKPFIITFDDGYLSNYSRAFPLLKEYGFKASIFVVTGSVGVSDIAFPHFNWAVAREMSKSDYIEILSHTNSHLDLTTLTGGKLMFELRRSKAVIEQQLGTKCYAIAAPFGRYNEETVLAAQSAGYKLMMCVGNVSEDVISDEMLFLKRHTVTGDMSASDVINMMENE